MGDEERGDRRRAQILDAAARVFADRGYHRTTVRHIAREAGIADGTMYLYFSGKQELLLALIALQARLQEATVEVTEEIDHGFVHSIYFTDPNGIALEASYWLSDATAKPESDRSAFSDPDPVPAVRELEAGARLDWMPATDLVPEPRGVS